MYTKRFSSSSIGSLLLLYCLNSSSSCLSASLVLPWFHHSLTCFFLSPFDPFTASPLHFPVSLFPGRKITSLQNPGEKHRFLSYLRQVSCHCGCFHPALWPSDDTALCAMLTRCPQEGKPQGGPRGRAGRPHRGTAGTREDADTPAERRDAGQARHVREDELRPGQVRWFTWAALKLLLSLALSLTTLFDPRWIEGHILNDQVGFGAFCS